MNLKITTGILRNFVILIKIVSILLIFFSLPVNGQEPPPRPITITATSQILAFGAFVHGPAGGTITISPDNSRGFSGEIFLLSMGYAYTAALFEIDANPGTVITLLTGPPVPLSGSNGGSMLLSIGSTNPGSPFVTTAVPPAKTLFYVGGSLAVGNAIANPPGSYSGNYNITLVQE
jgi:hypothetical protein